MSACTYEIDHWMPAKLVGRLTAKLVKRLTAKLVNCLTAKPMDCLTKFMDLLTAKLVNRLTAKLVDRLTAKPMVVNLFKLHLTKLKISFKIDLIFKIHHQGLIRPLFLHYSGYIQLTCPLFRLEVVFKWSYTPQKSYHLETDM